MMCQSWAHSPVVYTILFNLYNFPVGERVAGTGVDGTIPIVQMRRLRHRPGRKPESGLDPASSEEPWGQVKVCLAQTFRYALKSTGMNDMEAVGHMW